MQYSQSLPVSHKRAAIQSLLGRECVVFCQYLTGTKPNEYVIRKYEAAHRVGSVGGAGGHDPFDILLLKLARINPLATRVVDTYAALSFESCLLRRKLVLLLAILESCAPSHSYLDAVDKGPFLFLKIAQGVLSWFFVLLIAGIFLLPLRIVVSVIRAVLRRASTI